MKEKLKAPHVPCGSCPYRRDVPSGIWDRKEYEKLPAYDGPTWGQDTVIFFCHQNDGCVCGGWLACHGPRELLAVRIRGMAGHVDPSVLSYDPGVPVFGSGAEARDHGVRDIKRPGPRARKMVQGIMRKRGEL